MFGTEDFKEGTTAFWEKKSRLQENKLSILIHIVLTADSTIT
jgi:hypothetical protein